MNKQPEALQLADRLRDGWGLELRREAEAELRRLHEANEAFGKRQEWWNERMFVLENQRDALLEALKHITTSKSSRISAALARAAIDKARAAIAKCEENT